MTTRTSNIPSFEEWINQRDPAMCEAFWNKKLPGWAGGLITAAGLGVGYNAMSGDHQQATPTQPPAITQQSQFDADGIDPQSTANMKKAAIDRSNKLRADLYGGVQNSSAQFLGVKDGVHKYRVKAASEEEAKKQAKWIYEKNLGTTTYSGGTSTHNYTRTPTDIQSQIANDGSFIVSIKPIQFSFDDN